MNSDEKQIKYTELENGEFFGEVKSALSNAETSIAKIQHDADKSQGETTIQSIFGFRRALGRTIDSIDKLTDDTQALLQELGITLHATDDAVAKKIQK